jgi:hypothetical protein
MNLQTIRNPVLFLGLAVILLTGCRSIGPKTVPRDRSDYSASISESWKRQTLLNVVKLRYLDPPIFVTVGQIVAGYTLESGFSAGASLPANGSNGGNTADFGGSIRYTDRPTITYTPMTGDAFIKSLMTPLTPESVFSTIQSGWPADAILLATTARLNGLRNQSVSASGFQAADPRFLRALELLRAIQVSGGMGMRVTSSSNAPYATVLTFESEHVTEQTKADRKELHELLGLAPGANEFKLVAGALPQNDLELAIQTRSLIHLMSVLAADVEVPLEHVAEGRATPGLREAKGNGSPVTELVRILSSKKKPADAYVAVPYQDYWFWIDACDLKTKHTFAFMMLLFTLSDNAGTQNPPMLTIPTQ